MQNFECVARFICDGAIYLGSAAREDADFYKKLINALYFVDDPEKAYPISISETIERSRPLFEKLGIPLSLEIIRFKDVPLGDLEGFAQSKLDHGAYIGLGYRPNDIFRTTGNNKHISQIISTSRKGITISDRELESPRTLDWELAEAITNEIDGGFWILQRKSK